MREPIGPIQWIRFIFFCLGYFIDLYIHLWYSICNNILGIVRSKLPPFRWCECVINEPTVRYTHLYCRRLFFYFACEKRSFRARFGASSQRNWYTKTISSTEPQRTENQTISRIPYKFCRTFTKGAFNLKYLYSMVLVLKSLYTIKF